MDSLPQQLWYSSQEDLFLDLQIYATIYGYKFIIRRSTAYFEKAFQEAFVEGSLGMLTFNDGSGAAHWRVLEYLYTGDYSDDISNNFEGKAALKVNVLGILTATRRPPAAERPSRIRPCGYVLPRRLEGALHSQTSTQVTGSLDKRLVPRMHSRNICFYSG